MLPWKSNFSISAKIIPEKFLSAQSLLLLASVFIIYLAAGCDITGSSNRDDITTFEYNFRNSDESWEPFFTDYNVGWGEDMELTADYRKLPEPLNTSENAHFISAVNHSDDVKMLFRKQVIGLESNTTYRVGFTVRFATDVPSGCAGIGGAPGEAVKVIANASDIRPQPFVGGSNDDYYLLNIQHIGDSGDWYQNSIMGDIANSRECEEENVYEIKEVGSGPYHATVQTDGEGKAWLLFGTRSGFEGQTDLYYTYFKAEFSR